jgi:hypothetical protein
MALLDNSIGAHRFIAIYGVPEPPREVLELDERGGTDGTEITKLGIKGRPFQLVTHVDAVSYNFARSTFDQYRLLIADPPVDLIVGGVNSSAANPPYKVKVLNVTPIRIDRIAGAVGGLNAPSAGWLECAWDLIAIPN